MRKKKKYQLFFKTQRKAFKILSKPVLSFHYTIVLDNKFFLLATVLERPDFKIYYIQIDFLPPLPIVSSKIQKLAADNLPIYILD